MCGILLHGMWIWRGLVVGWRWGLLLLERRLEGVTIELLWKEINGEILMKNKHSVKGGYDKQEYK